jgi:hypothetical protein
MVVSDFPEIIQNSPSSSNGKLALNDYSIMKLRGSNFKKDAFLYTDSTTDTHWLWKVSNKNCMLKEYVISVIASRLNIQVPRAYFAKKGSTVGLLHEWIEDSSELKDTPSQTLLECQKHTIIRLLLLESWINASDRHGGNYLYSKGKIFAIDFEQTFTENSFDSELSLYFEWLKESETIILQELMKFQQDIISNNVIQECSKITQMIDTLPIDKRAQIAMKHQLSEICSSLHPNLDKLAERIHRYFHEPRVSYL